MHSGTRGSFGQTLGCGMATMLFRKRNANGSEEEVQRILARLQAPERQPEIAWQVGDAIVVTDGPFKGLKGRVASVDAKRHALSTLLRIAGRDTPIELHFDDAGRP